MRAPPWRDEAWDIMRQRQDVVFYLLTKRPQRVKEGDCDMPFEIVRNDIVNMQVDANNPDYKPSKATALAFAFALELDLEETKDFIGRAGFALSHSSKFDVIVEYFLVNRNYNVFELNEVLFAFDQPSIGV